MTNKNERLSIFNSKDEFINLSWPLVVVILLIGLKIAGLQTSVNMTNFIYVISNVLFLNVIHNIFSIFILVEIPEMEDYLRKHFQTQKFHLVYRSLCIFFFFFILMWIFPKFKNLDSYGNYLFWGAVFFIQFFALYYHTLRQIEGISTIYNQRMKLAVPAVSPQIDIIQKNEKKLFKTFFILSCTGYAMNVLNQTDWIYPLFILSCLNFILIFALNMTIPNWLRSNKWIYLLRLGAFTLGILYPIVGITTPFFHGMEYLFIVKKMFHKSSLQSHIIRRKIWTYMLPVSLIIGALSIFRLDRGFGVSVLSENDTLNTVVIIISCLSFAISFVHFYLDSFIFKMKDVGIRESVGKLIL